MTVCGQDDDDDTDLVLAAIVDGTHVADVTRLCQSNGLLHATFKTKPLVEDDVGARRRLAIPLKPGIHWSKSPSDETPQATRDLSGDSEPGHLLEQLSVNPAVELSHVSRSSFTGTDRKKQAAPAEIIISAFEESFATCDIVEDEALQELRTCLPQSSTMYDGLMLLPSTAFASPICHHTIRSRHETWQEFMRLLAGKAKATHIAINAPISPQIGSIEVTVSREQHSSSLAAALGGCSLATRRSTPPSCESDQEAPATNDNVLRSPSSLLPLYGSFGPLLPPSYIPSQQDYEEAYWASTTQNGIKQVWAPRYTMFSAGNIKEKARLLQISSVADAVKQGRLSGRGSAAVDLYVGIGYFTFSYLKAGVDVVLGWDLNTWSVEGLRRGAGLNRWGCLVFGESGQAEIEAVEGLLEGTASKSANVKQFRGSKDATRIIAFARDNRHAVDVVARLRDKLPPIRHVNCGLLPTSKDSWSVAVRVLDHELGGWIHVHENFAVGEIQAKAAAVKEEIQVLVKEMHGWSERTTVELEEISRVKSYAPGVFHCVVDVHIDPHGGDA